MIVKKFFDPIAVLRYMWQELLISVLLSSLVYVLNITDILPTFYLPFSIAAILGSALAIFLAFRNNNAYNRWWEARTIWGSIINNSRIFARQIISNADNARFSGKVSDENILQFKQKLIYRQIAFAHALRMQLRNQNNWETLQALLSEDEHKLLLQQQNKANFLLQKQGNSIKEGIRTEILGGFDNISLEPTLAGFNNFQGACERIKNTPLLRQYHFFTKLFLLTFIALLPFTLIHDFSKAGNAYLMIPVTVLISFVFGVMGKVGEVNEDPFENKITDVPMSAMCNTIERDLKEMLGETELPAKMQAENGFLF